MCIFTYFRNLSKKIDNITNLLKIILEKENKMSQELDVLTAQVAATIDIEKSAILLIQTLSAQIEALKLDPVALQALADSLNASAADLSAAIANIPAPVV
jgi:hypothetical protein